MEQKGKRLWYIVQTYSGKENSVKENLMSRASTMNMEDQIFNAVVPEHIEIEKKDDKTTKEKVVKDFPGYVFVEMIDNEKSWWVVRNTPGVTGFLGSAGKKTRPVPLSNDEIEPILRQCGLVKESEINFNVGDQVTVISGNYKDMTGLVESINKETNEVTLNVELFGRNVSITVSTSEAESVK